MHPRRLANPPLRISIVQFTKTMPLPIIDKPTMLRRREIAGGLLCLVGLTLLAGFLLQCDFALATDRSIAFRDSLFAAASSICLCGLRTLQVSDFSLAGKAILFTLMQTGSLTMLWLCAFGLRTALGQEYVSKLAALRHAIAFQIGIQLVAGGLLCMHVGPAGFVLACEAFCNTGLGLHGIDLTMYHTRAWPLLILTPTVLLGAVGWTCFIRDRNSPTCKASLSVLAWVLVIGSISIVISELSPNIADWLGQNVTANSKTPEPITLALLGNRLADACMVLLVGRTSGISTIDTESLRTASQFILICAMLVGGAVGGLTGGMRLGCISVAGRSVVGALRSYGLTEINPAIARAATLMISFHILLYGIATFLLCVLEPFPFFRLLHESISAATLSGLSIGITEHLSAQGKWVLITTMAMGRIVPVLIGIRCVNELLDSEQA